ncbi:MAG: hypothetical protein HY586_01050 [Candidatus Omnitrophica bacterium]|nr:hypothetical protein [Candidatus Omnitrophota bacterium]
MPFWIPFLVFLATRWVGKQKKVFYSLGKPLGEKEKQGLAGFFEPALLEHVKIVYLERLHPASLLTQARLWLLKIIFRKQHLAGLTLGGCVFVTDSIQTGEKINLSILFHELVHVTQYELLGIKEFLKQYLTSWAYHEYSYPQIALERVAYGLTHHFETFPGKPFSVKERVIGGLEIK